MSKIASGTRLSDEPKCATCKHWKVIHRGPRHLGVCAALSCLCPAFATSGVVSSPHSDPREGSLGESAADPDETSPVSASAPSIPSEAASVSSRESVGNKSTPHVVPTARAHQKRGAA